jgi:uncharacterized membrane protein YjjB (DUF3815 family)
MSWSDVPIVGLVALLGDLLILLMSLSLFLSLTRWAFFGSLFVVCRSLLWSVVRRIVPSGL